MSRLEELIEKLCPDGVEYKKLGDLCFVKGRIGWQRLKKSEYLTEGDYYLITGVDIRSDNRVDFQSCYYVSKERYDLDKNIQLQNDDIILTKDGTIGKVALIEGMDKPAVLNSHLFVIRDCSGELIPKFLMYVLLSNSFKNFIKKNQTKGTIPGLTQATIINFVVPVPPLEVQREIVLILDNFMELTEELTEELTARKQQYEYYRDELLTFEDEKMEYKTIGEISDIVRGASPRPIKNFLTDSADGINWIKIGDVKPDAKYITQVKEHITPKGAEKSRYVHKGDFLLSNSMSFGRPYILKIDGCIHDGWLSISNFSKYVTSDYLYYILISDTVQKEMAKKASFGGAVQNLNADIVRAIKIPVPTIQMQNQIVKILDTFESFCNDLTDGLPAEIEARQKQYDYYRDKLLTFKEKTS